MGALEADGALRSTADDLLVLLECFLDYRPSPLAAAMADMLETRRPGGMPPSKEIALAWNIAVRGLRTIVWKNGSVGGFRSFIGFDPKARVGIVALANAQTASGADDIGLHLLDPSFRVDLRPPVVRKEIILPPAVLDRYVGRYVYSPTDIIEVTREGPRLFVKMMGQDKLELFAEGERDFFFKVADAQITFETVGEGPARVAVWHQDGEDQRGERQ